MKNYFEGYGELEYITPEKFYANNARIIDNARDQDGELWTIILMTTDNGQEYVYSDC